MHPLLSQKVDLFLYINLPHRKDRDKSMKEVLVKQLGLPLHKIRRVEAVKGNPGFTGCTQSHLFALQYAIDAQVKNVCILEDDFVLTVSPKVFHARVAEAWHNRFHVIYLAMTPIRLKPLELSGFYRVKQALAMPAMIIDKSYFATLKKIYEQALLEEIPHDLVTQRYQGHDLWYGFYPPIARQKPSFSDIEGRDVDYKYLEVDGQMLKIVS